MSIMHLSSSLVAARKTPFATFLVALLILVSVVRVSSEVIELDLIIDAASDEVHFVRGYLQAPALISLSNIRLITNEDVIFDFGEDDQIDFEYDEGDDEYYDSEAMDRDETFNPQESPEDIVVPPPEIGGQTTPAEQIPAKETPAPESKPETPAQEIPAGDQPIAESKPETPAQETTVKDTPAQETPAAESKPETPAQETPTQEKPTAESKPETPAQETPVKDTPAQETPAVESKPETPAQETPTQETPTQAKPTAESKPETPAQETPVIDAPAQGKPAQETPVTETPAQETPVAESKPETPAQETPVIDTPAQETPVTETSAQETPVAESKPETPAQETPVIDTPAQETPVTETSAQETPVAESKPETPAQETPVKETPAEDTVVPEPNEETLAPTEDEGDNDDDGNVDDDEDDDSLDRNLQFEPQTSGDQVMDFVLFEIPKDCKRDFWGNCAWVPLGIGAYDDEMEGGMSYCCSRDTAQRGICDTHDTGTILIDRRLFKGEHRRVVVPTKPLQDFQMDDPIFDVKDSGDYVMVIANCDDDGLGVITLGTMEWKSAGGYLPGDIYGLMFFYAAMTGVYLFLVLWYHCGMRMFQDSAIPIQKYILATLVLGLLETSVQALDLFLWNADGKRIDVISYIALGLGILKEGSSRCLGVMVAMGWGVVRDSLGLTMIWIVGLGLVYSGLTLVHDFLQLAADKVTSISATEQQELTDLALLLSPVIFLVNLIFYWWIISALRSTADYLKNMNQSSKLRRHLRLRCLFVTSFVMVGILFIVHLVQIFTVILSPDLIWVFEAMGHGTYLFVLFGVAILWRPNSDAKNYVMQMELPCEGDSDNDLELSCVVPSAEDENAMDFDGDYKIGSAVAS